LKIKYLLCITFCYALISETLSAQVAPLTTLIKNNNIRAKSLEHELNNSNDTLILKSETKISYVYSINRKYQREVDNSLDTNEFRIPLDSLSKGKHVIVVGHSKMKIVFVLWVREEPSVPKFDRKALITSANN